ncbi:hypothetical protein CSIM01_00215 [Colletotrichum simmondsii]|uniref:CorA-like Mg2+ transporter n=1 Tax=Colletotrichum simmondsii TaxID=703756 RepID=A0A135SMJ9_9PEZI|nr:hypothetical protein CSIM01_00215 [Colletotrichum simmondsii]
MSSFPIKVATSDRHERMLSKLTEAAEAGKKRESFFSFGNEGLTATVGASGRLLRISRHFSDADVGTVGICVDFQHMPEPYYVVERLEKLLAMAADTPSGEGIGVRVDVPNYPDGPQHVYMVNHRWPTFHRKTADGVVFTLQYVASGDTIYQKFEFCNDAETDSSSDSGHRILPLLMVEPDLLIRKLDYVDPSNKFNKTVANDLAYDFEAEGDTIIRYHDGAAFRILLLSDTDSFGFTCRDYSQASPLDTQETEPPWFITRLRTGQSGSSSGTSEVLRIILAYTLEYTSDDNNAMHPLDPMEEIGASSFRHLTWVDASATMDRLLRPCAEHNCIPVPVASREELPVALTCGDVDSHRVATTASFYSFQLLLLALQSLDRSCNCGGDDPYLAESPPICAMRARIEKICRGHMKWLFMDPTESPREKVFCPNYWVSGREIRGWKYNEYLPGKSLVDTALQIIKAGNFWEISKNREHHKSIEIIIRRWIEDIDETTSWELYMFPRYDSEPTRSYHLTDHALIWQAIELAHGMGISTKPQFADRNYSPAYLRQAVLQGFTVQNHGEEAQQSMIAVTRGLALNRFSLGPEETALMGPIDLGFFGKGRSQDLQWENTVANQVGLEENNSNRNDPSLDPRGYVLSLLQFRKQSSPESAYDAVLKDVANLLRSSSANGLFPGNLDDDDEPILYVNDSLRDRHWSTAFEIPYILWKRKSGLLHPTLFVDSPTTTARAAFDGVMQPAQIEREASAQVGNLMLRDPRSTHRRRHRRCNSIQQLPAPRWHPHIEVSEKKLFSNAPPFFIPPVASTVTRSQKVSSLVNNCLDPENIETRAHIRNRREPVNERYLESKECIGILIDIPRPYGVRKKQGGGVPMERITTHQAIEEIMDRGRSHEKSKKRFWAFFSSDPSNNDVCIRTVPDRQSKKHDGKESFCRRHKAFAKVFSEEISKPLNKWETEFHMAIYDVQSGNGDYDALDSRTFTRGMISFSLEGDISGKYWTCRFMEANPHWNKEVESHFGVSTRQVTMEHGVERLAHIVRSLLQNGDANSNKIRLGKDAWHQRRVLELILFSRAVEKLHSGANNVLEAAISSIQNIQPKGNKSLEEERNYDVFVRKTKRIRHVLQVLQTVKGGLDENIGEIDLWRDRKGFRTETSRGSTDDVYIQEVIQNLEGSYEHHIHQIRRVLSRIDYFEQSTSRMLILMNSEMERRRADNIRQFTFVTVVFLPLGFATGVFSMSGAPASRTLLSMTFTAVVALAVTALLLFNAKTVRALYFWIYGFPERVTSKFSALIDALVTFEWRLQLWGFSYTLCRQFRRLGRQASRGLRRTGKEIYDLITAIRQKVNRTGEEDFVDLV